MRAVCVKGAETSAKVPESLWRQDSEASSRVGGKNPGASGSRCSCPRQDPGRNFKGFESNGSRGRAGTQPSHLPVLWHGRRGAWEFQDLRH